jgi:hypothetical protein
LQDRFRVGRYLERAEAGEFGCSLKKDSTPPASHQGPGARSVTVCYLDRNGFRVFVVHLYLVPRADGNWDIGASGQPDPKWLFEDGTVLRPAAQGA